MAEFEHPTKNDAPSELIQPSMMMPSEQHPCLVSAIQILQSYT